MTIALVVPAYNEEEVIEDTLSRIRGFILDNRPENWAIVLVDDGSTDRTLSIAEDFKVFLPQLEIVPLSRNFGHQAALIAGLEAIDAEAYVMLDADLQDPIEVVPQLVRTWRETGCDTVIAVRNSRPGESWLKLFLAKFFYRAFDFLVPFRYPRDSGDFRLISKLVRDEIIHSDERDIILRAAIPWLGGNEQAVRYDRHERRGGSTKYTLRSQWLLGVRSVISSSTRPLEVISLLAVLSGFITFLYLLWIFGRAIYSDTQIEGWASTIGAVLAIGTFQLFSSGVIAAYLSKILSNTAGRPRYVRRRNYNQ